jgi:hypothetical protein
MQYKKIIYLTFVLFLILSVRTVLVAQDNNNIEIKDSIQIISDTMTTKPLDEFIKNEPVINEKFKMTKSPTKAIVLSLIFPGLGQYYVESYWKIPIFVGANGGLIYTIIYYNNQYKNIKEQMDLIVDKSSTTYNNFNSEKEFYRDNRDRFTFFLAGVYILAAVDAYVGAHLYDFDVSDDISMNMGLNKIGTINLQFSYKW